MHDDPDLRCTDVRTGAPSFRAKGDEESPDRPTTTQADSSPPTDRAFPRRPASTAQRSTIPPHTYPIVILMGEPAPPSTRTHTAHSRHSPHPPPYAPPPAPLTTTTATFTTARRTRRPRRRGSQRRRRSRRGSPPCGRRRRPRWVRGADLALAYERWRGRVGVEGSGEGSKARAKPVSTSPSSNTISVPLPFAGDPRGAHGS